MGRRLLVEIIGDPSSLLRATAVSAAALDKVKLGAAQAAESRVSATQILDGVRGISDASRAAAAALDQVRLTGTDAAESVVAGDAIKTNIRSVGDAATAAAAKVAFLRVAAGGIFGGGGGGLLAGLGFHGGGGIGLPGWGWAGGLRIPGARFGSLGMFAGFGAEHLLTTLLGVAGSGVQAGIGGSLLGLGAAGTMAVGMGTDMAGIGQAANDIKTVTPLVAKLDQAIQQYGKNSAQAAAAQKALDQGLAGFSGKARAAVLAAAQTANQFHAMFNSATGAAESVGAQIITEAMKVGEAFLPTIGKYALQNMNILKRDIQPLFDWLKNGAFAGPGRGGGLGIFTNLEQIFQKNLPTSIHAMSQGFELLMRVIDVSAQHLGGFTKKLDEILTRLNGADFGKVAHFVDSSIQAFDVWMRMFGEFGKMIVEAFKPALGVGRMVIETLGRLFAATAAWLGAKGTQDVLGKLFSAHKAELEAIFRVIGAALPALAGFASAFMQIAAVVSRLVAGPLGVLADAIREITKFPLADKIIGWGAALYVFGGALVTVISAVDPLYLAIFALALAADEIYKHWGAIASFFTGVWDDVKRLFDEGIRFVESHWRDFAVALATLIAGPLGALVAYIATHWAQVEADAVRVWHTIEADLTSVWHTIRDIAVSVWDEIKSHLGVIAVAVATAILGPIAGLVALIATHWRQILHAAEAAWARIRDAVAHALSAIRTAISDAVGWVAGEAERIGHAIVDGIVHGAGGLAHALGGLLKGGVGGALHDLTSFLGANSPSRVFRNQVGLPISEGIIQGYLEGIGPLSGQMTLTLRQSLERAKATINGYRSQFASAWSTMASDANTALAGIQQARGTPAGRLLSSLTTVHDTEDFKANVAQAESDLRNAYGAAGYGAMNPVQLEQLATAQTRVQLATDALTQANEKETAAQQALAAATAKYGATSKQTTAASIAYQAAQDSVTRSTLSLQGAQAALAKAQPNLSDKVAAAFARMQAAQEGLTDATRRYGAASAQAVAANKVLQTATANAQIAVAGEQAGPQQQNDQAVIDAQKNLNDLLYGQMQTALQKQAALEKTQAAARLAEQKKSMDQALKALMLHLERVKATHATAENAIVALLHSYGVSYRAAGESLGDAFAAGIEASISKAAAAAEKLSREVSKYLPHSPAEKGPLSRPIGWQSYLMAGLGASAAAASAALASGLSAPSGMSPGGGAAAAARPAQINVTVNGWVGTDQEIAYRLRDELVAIGRREPNVFAGFA